MPLFVICTSSIPMDSRAQQLLRLIIDDYIKTAKPVGSQYLVETYGLSSSSATIRHELSLLEEEGYLRQPHTSSGRVPTEKAYLYYLQHVMGEESSIKKQPSFEIKEQDQESTLKAIAKRLVEIFGETAIVGFDRNWSYYTGVSNLFLKPEFQDANIAVSLGELIDQFDQVMTNVFDQVPFETQVLIGSHNPFGDQMTTMMIRYRLPNGAHGILGLVGPMRMNYARNLALLQQAQQLIERI